MNTTFRIANAADIPVLNTHPPIAGVDCAHEREVTSDNTSYLLAEIDNTLVGHAYVRWTGPVAGEFVAAFPDCVVLNSLCVWPDDMRRKGLGSMLVNQLEELVATRGRIQIGLGVYVDNANAIAFYKSLGYEFWSQSPILDRNLDIHPEGWTVMTKDLRA